MDKLSGMRIFRAQSATTWVILIAYCIVAPVLSAGQIFCEGTDGHRTVEFAYVTCPTSQSGVEGNALGEGLASTSDLPCTDTRITSYNPQRYSGRVTADLKKIISLPVAGFLSAPSSTDEPMAVYSQLHASPLGHGYSLDALRTVVLLI